MKECPHCLSCFVDMDEACPLDGTPLVDGFQGDPIIDNKYRVERRLGRGGMGVVYRVRHLGLQKEFALKLIDIPRDGDQSFVKRFRTEATALGRLKHPNIVEVTDYGVDPRGNGLPYLVMEYLDGTTLQNHYRKEGAIPLERSLPILDAISSAIDYAHGQGVHHRDLKPSNVLLSQAEDGTQTTKILDFGLARLVARSSDLPGSNAAAQISFSNPPVCEDEMQPPGPYSAETLDGGLDENDSTLADGADPDKGTGKGSVLGTTAYLSPEAIGGEGGTAGSDIYAFGVLIYEVLVGRLPFRGSMMQIFYGHLRGEVPVPSATNANLPQEIDAAVLAPLAKDPAGRPKSAVEVVAAVRKAWNRAEIRKWRTREIPRRLKFALTLAVGVLLLAALVERIDLVQELERRTVDARFALHPQRPPDPRLSLVLLDEASLDADRTPLADRGDEFGQQFDRIFGAGASWVAVDIVLPEHWSLREKFSKSVLRHAENLTLAVDSSNSGKSTGMECVEGLTAAALGPTRVSELFGFVNLDADPDGVTRRTRSYFHDVDGKKRESWAARATRSFPHFGPKDPQVSSVPEQIWVDYSTDWEKIPKTSWKDVAGTIGHDPSVFRDRLVIVGESFDVSGDDHRIPARGEQPKSIAGVIQQAVIINTILSGMSVREMNLVVLSIVAFVVWAGLMAAVLCLARLVVPIFVYFGLCFGYVAASVLIFRQRELILPLAGPILTTTLAMALGLVLRFALPRFPKAEKEF
jgi:serine/threonine protein kinase/CHASE2 domain-containing sensor protein